MPDDIFQKFHTLPQNVKNVLTSPESLATQEVLEEKYGIPLADLLMRIVIKEVSFSSLPTYLREREHMESGKADALVEELRENILGKALPYLEGRAQTVTPQVALQTVQPTLANTAATATPRPAAPPTGPMANIPSAPVPQSQPVPPVPPVLPRPPVVAPPSTRLRPTVPAQKAPYLIDAKDDEDIVKQGKKLASFASTPPATSLEHRADEFLRQQHLTFASDVLAKRFRTVVLSRLHDVRDKLGTEEMLTKPAKIGGMEFDEKSARRISGALEQEAARLHDAAQSLPPVPAQPKRQGEKALPKTTIIPPFVRDAARAITPPVLQPKQVAATTLASVAALRRLNTQSGTLPNVAPRPALTLMTLPKTLQPNLSPAHPVPPLQTPGSVPPQSVPRPVSVLARPIPVQAVSPPPLQTMQVAAPRQAMAQVGKQMVHDIRRPSRPMSSVDELADITVDDFRRLGDTLPDSAAKVVEKIHLLAEDSLAKRAEGVAAWRKSMVNQLYLSMGRESMVTGKTIDEIIQARERAHQPTLTAQEFALVSDINRHLTA